MDRPRSGDVVYTSWAIQRWQPRPWPPAHPLSDGPSRQCRQGWVAPAGTPSHGVACANERTRGAHLGGVLASSPQGGAVLGLHRLWVYPRRGAHPPPLAASKHQAPPAAADTASLLHTQGRALQGPSPRVCRTHKGISMHARALERVPILG